MLSSTKLVYPAERKSETSRAFDGVVTSFHIKRSTIKLGEPLLVDYQLRNTSRRTVRFRYLPVSVHQRIFSHGVEVATKCTALMEFATRHVTLRPGESVEVHDSAEITACFNLTPGEYTIRFHYDLSLLPDRTMAERYAEQYHAIKFLVPWDDDDHVFHMVR
jgi:hypothetical protein